MTEIPSRESMLVEFYNRDCPHSKDEPTIAFECAICCVDLLARRDEMVIEEIANRIDERYVSDMCGVKNTVAFVRALKGKLR